MKKEWSREELQQAIIESDARSTGGRPKMDKKEKQEMITVNVGVPMEVLVEYDIWCKENEYTRAQHIRRLVKQHLKSVKEEK